MKIQQFIIILLFSVVLGQFSTNILNGFGNNSHIIPPSSESMGNMWMFNNKANGWNPLLASSLYKTDLTMIAVSSSFEGISINDSNINNHLINLVSFSFPISNNTGFGFALSPYTRTGYNIADDDYNMIAGTEYSSPLASKNTYDITGGISKLSLSLSRAFFHEKLSLGIKWNILFGNQSIRTTTTLAEVSYDQEENQIFTVKDQIIINDEFNHFNAYSYEFDSKIRFKNNSFSLLINFLDNFKIDRVEAPMNYLISKNYLFDKIQLDQLAIGYMYSRNNNFGIAVEGHFKNQLKYPESIMILDNLSPSELSFHNGIYKIIDNAKAGSWNAINFSTGYSYKLIKFTERDLNDISFSLGMGISFNERRNDIDISFTVGLRESIIETIDWENYYKLNIAILAGDKWFEKRRRN